MANNIGKITQIIGAVLDIKFTERKLPYPVKRRSGGKRIDR